MTEAQVEEHFPRHILLAAAGLLAVAILAAGFGRVTQIGIVRVDDSTPWKSTRMRFEDRPDGAVVVIDAASGMESARFESGEGGFLRGVLRSLARERAASGIGAEPPFELTQFEDGHLSLRDVATDRRIEIDAFGPDNAETFRRLLEDAR